MLACSFFIESSSKLLVTNEMHRRSKGFDFDHIQTGAIGVTWPWAIAFLLKNYLKCFDACTCKLPGERSLPFGLIVWLTWVEGSQTEFMGWDLSLCPYVRKYYQT